MGGGQQDRADRLEPAAQMYALVDVQAVGEQGGTGVIAQLCAVALQPEEVGAGQADRAEFTRANRLEPAREEDALVGPHAVGEQGGT